jgi:hypothetical protein
MSKWREERTFEIITHLSNNKELDLIYRKEIQKSEAKYPHSEFFERMEKCYEKAKQKYENL